MSGDNTKMMDPLPGSSASFMSKVFPVIQSQLLAALASAFFPLVVCTSFAFGAESARQSVAVPTVTQPPASALAPKPASASADSDSRSAAKPAASTSVPLQPAPPNFDLQGRSHEVLDHLNGVVRFFRLSLTPIQKVGEPSDLLYRDQALNASQEIAELAFQSARAEASLLVAYQKEAGKLPTTGEGESQKLQAVRANVEQRSADLKTQQKTIQTALSRARTKDRPVLEQQEEQIEGAIELNSAMNDALSKIVGMSDTKGTVGLAADIERLQRSVPELISSKTTPIVSQPLQSLSVARSAGVSSKASVLFTLLTTRHSIDQWIVENDKLHDQALTLRTPLTNIVRSLIQSGETLSDQVQQQHAPPPANAPRVNEAESLEAIHLRFDSVTATFKVLSAAVVPLSQEIITIEQNRSNLLAWRAAVNTEYQEVLRELLWRIVEIAIALGILFVLGEVWRRTTIRYVHDLRRRRQLLVMRRIVLGFLSGLVVILGFVTQFNSLATFAGFITAGLAVGLQTILLSVAAYFFIVGRFGVRVGDRISVAGVTGDVIDVGLVRFYMMELAGSGTELQPTGRVAVFSNSVLFQAGTPLFKQMPGTEYAWHELTVKLALSANYGPASESMVHVVKSVYSDYSAGIERQYRDVQAWMDLPTDAPRIDSRLQLVDGGLQLWVRYPVEIQKSAEIDERITQAFLTLMRENTEVKSAVTAPPAIRAVVKG